VSLRIATGLVVLGLGRGAAAERAIVVDAADAPFAAAELAAAIRVRVPLAGPPLHVRVTAIDGGVHVAADGGARDVELGDRRGVDAARLVALAANDLMIDQPIAVEAGQPPRARSTALDVLAGAASWNGVLAGIAVEVAIPQGAWQISADLGGGALLRGPVQLADAEARVGLGRLIGPLELRVEAIAEPLFVSTGAGDITALLGASASVRARIPLGDVRVVLAAGGDAFATQTEYRVAGAEVLTTPRIAPWLRVGVEVPL
jgi:hypothetical protein